MIYSVSSLNIEQNQNYNEGFSMGRSLAMPGLTQTTVNVTFELHNFSLEELKNTESFEKALKQDEVLDGAPSYKELLKKYHPEYLL